MNREEWKDYKKLSGEITEKLDNTSTYESWLIIQEYIDRCQQKNKKYKEVIDKAIEELKKGLHELDTRRREEVYAEEYIEESIDILKEVE